MNDFNYMEKLGEGAFGKVVSEELKNNLGRRKGPLLYQANRNAFSRCLMFKRALTGKARGREEILSLRGVYGSSTLCRTDFAERVCFFLLYRF